MSLLYYEERYVYVENHDTEKEKRFGSDGMEPYQTRFDSVGDLYRACLKQHGRCISKNYIDQKGKTIQVGWVFFKKAQDKDHYDMEVWITVYRQPPTRKVEWVGAVYPTFKK